MMAEATSIQYYYYMHVYHLSNGIRGTYVVNSTIQVFTILLHVQLGPWLAAEIPDLVARGVLKPN